MISMIEPDAFKALSEPLRLRAAVLLTDSELCVCRLMEVLGAPQSTVSRHMSRLKAAGLVADRREGRWVYYALAANADFALPGLRVLLWSLRGREPYRADLARLAAGGSVDGPSCGVVRQGE